METKLKDRLREAAILAEQMTHGEGLAKVEILPGGVRLSYMWRGSDKGFYTTESLTPWQGVENATKNPLIAALTDLTKQAGVLG